MKLEIKNKKKNKQHLTLFFYNSKNPIPKKYDNSSGIELYTYYCSTFNGTVHKLYMSSIVNGKDIFSERFINDWGSISSFSVPFKYLFACISNTFFRQTMSSAIAIIFPFIKAALLVMTTNWKQKNLIVYLSSLNTSLYHKCYHSIVECLTGVCHFPVSWEYSSISIPLQSTIIVENWINEKTWYLHKMKKMVLVCGR